MDIYEVVTKLVGPIEPAGDSSIDGDRLKNLKVTTDLVDRLLTDISNVAELGNTHLCYPKEHSVRVAAKHANEFFDKIGIEE